jgi:hypothetical protein
MKWERLHANAITAAGYVIVRCCDYGKPNGLYHVMRGRTDRKKNKFPRSLGYFDSAEKAKAFCASHRLASIPTDPGKPDAGRARAPSADTADGRDNPVPELRATPRQAVRAVPGD